MTVTYATWTDVTLVAPIPIPATAQARVTEYIVQASTRLRAIVLGLDKRLADGRLEPDLVKGVVVDAVLRLAYNPLGVQSQTAGPFNMSKSGGLARDSIAFDEEQVQALLGPGEIVPETFGLSVAWKPGLPQIPTLPGMTDMPFPGPVPVSAAIDAFRGYPYTSESVRAVWAAYGSPWDF